MFIAGICLKNQMDILYITYPFSALLTFGMALGLYYYLTRHFKLGWGLYWIGGAVFILSQVGHIPFNALAIPAMIRSGILPIPAPQWAQAYNGLVLGLSAGAFESIARYLMYRFWTKEARSWKKGVLLGAGHGGSEAMIIGVIIFWTYLQAVSLKEADLALVIPAEQLALAERQLAAFWSAPWYVSLMGALERAITIPAHIALSVMVLQVFTRRQTRWLFVAIGWHALFDGFGAVYASHVWGIYTAELILGIFSILSIAILIALREPEQPEAIIPPVAEPPVPFSILPVEESEEQIDAARYSEKC
jgi:uncharacterized membrane protein YhfC